MSFPSESYVSRVSWPLENLNTFCGTYYFSMDVGIGIGTLAWRWLVVLSNAVSRAGELWIITAAWFVVVGA
jgi:hypothetical protein